MCRRIELAAKLPASEVFNANRKRITVAASGPKAFDDVLRLRVDDGTLVCASPLLSEKVTQWAIFVLRRAVQGPTNAQLTPNAPRKGAC